MLNKIYHDISSHKKKVDHILARSRKTCNIKGKIKFELLSYDLFLLLFSFKKRKTNSWNLSSVNKDQSISLLNVFFILIV